MSGLNDWLLARLPSEEQLGALERDPAQLVNVMFKRAIAVPTQQPIASERAKKEEIERWMSRALELASLLMKNANFVLSDEDKLVLQVFVMAVSRPALLTRDGIPETPAENWKVIDGKRQIIKTLACRVGLIQLAGDAIGTGCFVGDRRIMTNNHVVCALLGEGMRFWELSPDAYTTRCGGTAPWKTTAVLDVGAEFDVAPKIGSAVKITRVVAHHPTLDVAVLEVSDMPAGVTRGLTLAKTPPDPLLQRTIYALGYPVTDAKTALGPVTPPPVFARIFGTDKNALAKKRCSPGYVISSGPEQLSHDASTLPGSSGSCIVDLATAEMIAIHFGGRYEQANYAVPTWRLHSDHVFAESGVEIRR